jgi:hypothetical protein
VWSTSDVRIQDGQSVQRFDGEPRAVHEHLERARGSRSLPACRRLASTTPSRLPRGVELRQEVLRAGRDEDLGVGAAAFAMPLA